MNNIDNKNKMIRLKDLINTFSKTYEISLHDAKDYEKLFICLSNSKALEHYGNWVVTDICINHSGITLVLYIKEE